MTNPFKLTIDPTAARQEAEEQLRQAKTVEQAYKLAAFAQRLHGHRRLFEKYGLFLAFKPDHQYPSIYIIKRDHSAWTKIWWCVDALRLDAYSRFSSSGEWYDVMNVELTADLDFAEKCLMGLLARDELRFGNAYLPGHVIALDRVGVPALSKPRPAALPPPVIEAEIIAPERARSTAERSSRLVPVPLSNPPRPSWWRRTFSG